MSDELALHKSHFVCCLCNQTLNLPYIEDECSHDGLRHTWHIIHHFVTPNMTFFNLRINTKKSLRFN